MTIERTWISARIARRQVEAEGIISLDLVSLEGSDLPPFSAGSHIDVEIAPGLIRQYSLCTPGGEHGHYQIAALRDPQSRGGSIAIHEQLREGDTVRVSAPRNHFPLQPTEGVSLLLAGGIGITPLLCMAERLAATGGCFRLHYCARSPERTAFRDRIAGSPIGAHTHFHFDSEGPAAALDPAGLFAAMGPEDHAYVCGPSGFIDWIDEAARTAGLPPERLHREYFAAGEAAVPEGGNRSFAITIASTGQVVQVGADETVAAALSRVGHEVPTSCDHGVCGTCITRILEGDPDHRDLLGLSGHAEFTPCCSRAKTPTLVLDL